jgi:hypothetical protein
MYLGGRATWRKGFMKLRRKPLALGLAAAVLAATAAAVGAVGAAHAATAKPTVTVPTVTVLTDSSVSVSWTLSHGAVKAGIQVYPAAPGPSAFHENLTGSSTTITGLEDDNVYYVRATPIDAHGKSYGWTATNLFFTKASYGVGQVWVDRGNGYAEWATNSVALESNAPEGNTTSGAFRFTCRNVTAGCNVQLRAYATASGYALYPRILLFQQVGATVNSDPETYDEYGDGANNTGETAPLNPGARVPLTKTATAIPVGYGLTFDSGGTNPGSPNGATVLNVPGLTGVGAQYDVFTTWMFVKS